MLGNIINPLQDTVAVTRLKENGNLNRKTEIICVLTIICLMIPAFVHMNLAGAIDMPSPSWRTRTNMPSSRGQVAVMAGDDGLVYAMGGFDGTDPLNSVRAYDPLSDTWTSKAAMPWVTRGAGVAKGLDGIIYVISGYNGSSYANAVQAYNTTSDSWTLKEPVPIPAWVGTAATGNDGRVYFFGGEADDVSISNLTQIYDPVTDTWTNGTQMPTARLGLGAVTGADGLIYVFGGYNGSTLTVVEAYNPASGTWATKTPMPYAKLEFGIVRAADNKIYIIGGGREYGNNLGPFYDTVEAYDPTTNSWSIPTWSESLLPTARKELGATLGKNGRIYAVGGANGAYLNTNEEGLITLQNLPPVAYIDSVSPNPAIAGQAVTLVGHGSDSDGGIIAYQWRSSIDGAIGSTATLNASSLSNGTHTIYFSVQDNSGAWSPEASAVLMVQTQVTDDPIYQKVDDLQTENAALSQKIDQMYLVMLGLGIVTIILVLALMAVVFMRKRPPSMGAISPPA
jgi:N-acetylneuraminic acid mutarotase